MLKSLEIKNFRCFRHLTVEPLKRVNLIAGCNNTGKTALLEALFVLLALDKAAQRLPNLFRASNPKADLQENFWAWLLHDKDGNAAAEIQARSHNWPSCRVLIRYDAAKHPMEPWVPVRHSSLGSLAATLGSHYPFDNRSDDEKERWNKAGREAVQGWKTVVFSTHLPDPIRHAMEFSSVVRRLKEEQVVSLLKEVDGRLQSLRPLPNEGGDPLLYGNIGLREMIPVTQLGSGFCRLLAIYSELVAGGANFLLIDEIENGLHHSVLPTVWRGLAVAAKQMGVQIFATTHSLECVAAAHEEFQAAGDYDDAFAVHRLQTVNGEIEAVTYTREMVEASLKTGLEIR